MNHPTFMFRALALLVAACGVAHAQTPAQMEYERQQREYWRQQEQQRQEQQRQQQVMQENARRQQEEMRRINTPPSPGSPSPAAPGPQPGGGGGGGARGGQQNGADALAAAREMWGKRPPLPAERNPLLGGRWARPASTRTNSSDPFAALQDLARGGLCAVFFGGGVFEFRQDKLVGMDERTAEQELDRVDYRGNEKHVVVLPKTTLKLMEFDVDGPNRISWTGQNCVLVRVAAASTAAGVAAPSRPAAEAGVLALSVDALSSTHRVAGRKLWVLKTDAQVALIKGGLQSSPDGSVLQNWMRACQARTPACEKGARALQAFSVGVATTDANGQVRIPSLPSGRYWVLSDTKADNKHLMWNLPVDLTPSGNTLTLARGNAMPVD